MTWLSEKNGQGETGWTVLKSEFSRVGKKFSSPQTAGSLASGALLVAAKVSLMACVGTFMFNHLADDTKKYKDASYDNSMSAAYYKTDFKKAALWGGAGGALLLPLMLPFVGFSESRKKWQEGNEPKSPNSGPV